MIQIVIFDIGRVLVEWEPEQFYVAELGAVRAASFFANVPMMERHFRSDEGENFFEESDFQWRPRTFTTTIIYKLSKKRDKRRRGQSRQWDGGDGEF